jgi:hypothetical protein
VTIVIFYSLIYLPAEDFKNIWKTAQTYEKEDIPIGCHFIESFEKQPLAVVEAPNLYIREAYEKLYDLAKQSDDQFSRILITGTSGFGKSCYLVYLLIRLLKENFTVIFQSNPVNYGFVYCFCGLETYMVESDIKYFSHYLDSPNAWYLVDGGVTW